MKLYVGASVLRSYFALLIMNRIYSCVNVYVRNKSVRRGLNGIRKNVVVTVWNRIALKIIRFLIWKYVHVNVLNFFALLTMCKIMKIVNVYVRNKTVVTKERILDGIKINVLVTVWKWNAREIWYLINRYVVANVQKIYFALLVI